MVVEISDWYDLDAVRNDLNEDYALVNDLTKQTDGYDDVVAVETDEGFGFTPISDGSDPFTGEFDGRGNTIHGLKMIRIGEDQHLFPGLEDAFVHDLTLRNVRVEGRSDDAAPLCGSASGNPGNTIENVHVNGAVIKGNSAAGLCIRVGGDITNCTIRNAHVNGWTQSGGFVDNADGVSPTFTDCYTFADVQSANNSSGFCHSENVDEGVEFVRCGAVNNVTVVGGDGAGFHGLLITDEDCTFTDCISIGNVIAETDAAGFADSPNGGVYDRCAVVSGLVYSDSTDANGFGTGFDSGDQVTNSYVYVDDVTGGETDSFVVAGADDSNYAGTNASTSSDAIDLSKDSLQGSQAEDEMGNLDFTNDWKTVEGVDTGVTADQVPINRRADEKIQLDALGVRDNTTIELTALFEDSPAEGATVFVANLDTGDTGLVSATLSNGKAFVPADPIADSGERVMIGVEFDDGEDRYGKLVTTVV